MFEGRNGTILIKGNGPESVLIENSAPRSNFKVLEQFNISFTFSLKMFRVFLSILLSNVRWNMLIFLNKRSKSPGKWTCTTLSTINIQQENSVERRYKKRAPAYATKTGMISRLLLSACYQSYHQLQSQLQKKPGGIFSLPSHFWSSIFVLQLFSADKFFF